jgi:DNA repair exonuclease SbcCD ATPase subunit/DNA repair exonuclease SbcCD nuclease subunit
MFTLKSNQDGTIIKNIIHASDIHIRTGDLERSRYTEYYQVFQQCIDKVKETSDSVILLTGDIFHNKGKIEPAGLCLAHFLLDGLLQHTDVIFICGNHDYRQDDPTIPDMIDSIYNNYFKNKVDTPHEAYYLNKTGVYTYYNLQFGVVDIRDHLKTYNTSGRVDESIPFPKAEKKEGVTNIALFHGMDFHDSWIGREYDYILLGDNHKCMIDGCKGYAGSLIQQDFGESFYRHGYLVWNIKDRKVKHVELFNDYGFCTLKEQNNKLYMHHKNREWLELDTVNPFPKYPSIRVCEGTSLDSIQSYFEKNDIHPKYMNSWNGIAEESEDAPLENTFTLLEELNSNENWIKYLKPHIPNLREDFIYHPENLKIPILDISSDFVKKYQERNTKIQKSIDEYVKHTSNLRKQTPKVSLSHVQWAYIMCFGDKNTFDFTSLEHKITLLNGKNAMGKSSFLDVICIGLYGQPTKMRHMITGKKYTDKIIHDQRPANTSTPFVRLLLKVGSDQFEIYRSFGSQGGKDKEHLLLQTAIQLYKVNNFERTIFMEGSTLVDHWVSENIGDMDSVLMSTMLCQVDLNNFFYLKQDDQKAILDKALQLDNVSLFGKILKESILGHQDILQQIKTAEQTIQRTLPSLSITNEDILAQEERIHELESLKQIYQQRITKKEKDQVQGDIEILYKQAELDYENLENKDINLSDYYRTAERLDQLTLAYEELKDIEILQNDEVLYDKWNKKYKKFLEKEPKCDRSIQWVEDSFEKYTEWIQENTIDYNLEEIEKQGGGSMISKPKYPRKEIKGTCHVPSHKSVDLSKYAQLETINFDDIIKQHDKYKKSLEVYKQKTKEHDELQKGIQVMKLEYNSKCTCCNTNETFLKQLKEYSIQLQNYLKTSNEKIALWENKVKEYQAIIEIYPAYYHTIQENNKQWDAYEQSIKTKELYKKAHQYHLEKTKWNEFVAKYSDVYEQHRIWEQEHVIIKQNVESYKKSVEKSKITKELALLKESYDSMKQSVDIYVAYEKYKNLLYTQKVESVEKELKQLNQSYLRNKTEKEQYDKHITLYNQLKAQETLLEERVIEIKQLDTYFIGDKTQNDGYKEWIYKCQVIPMLNTKINNFLKLFENFTFEMIYKKKNFIYLLHDRGNTPTLDKASGYQNFIIGIALRITLSSIGAIGQQFKHLFIDEGFTACDYQNIQKVPQLLKNILQVGNYHSIILMSHLDSVRECSQVNITIARKDPFSFIQHGSYPDITGGLKIKKIKQYSNNT